MRFPLITLASLLLLCGILAGFFSTFRHVNSEHIAEYQELLKSADPERAQEQTPYTATQQHRQTHKDIWYTHKGQRLQVRLRSADTELVLDHRDDNTQIVEHMHNVICFMQEDIYYILPDGREVQYQPTGQLMLRDRNVNDPEAIVKADHSSLVPMQVVRHMVADAATYYYQTDHFSAEQVHISRYIAPGHTLMETTQGLKPVMTGIARSVDFSLVGNDLKFTAYQLKATLHGPSRRLL